MGYWVRASAVLVAILLGSAVAYTQSTTDSSADTSGAQAVIQALQGSTKTSPQTLQAFPALKAESCKAAVQYVESPSGLLGVWDTDMTKYTIYRDGVGSLQQVKADLLSDTWWARSSGADLARNVSTLCNLVQHVASALTPAGGAVDFAANVSKEFGMAVKQQSVRVYQGIEMGQNIQEVLADGTDALVLLSAQDSLKRAGYGQFAAVLDILKDVETHAREAQEAAEFKLAVQEQIWNLDRLINQNRNDMTAQREKLEAVEALKNAVVAACNSGKPIQSPPEFATEAPDANQPVQNASGPVEPSISPWWAMIPAITQTAGRIAVKPTTVPKQAPPSATKPSNPTSTDGVYGSKPPN